MRELIVQGVAGTGTVRQGEAPLRPTLDAAGVGTFVWQIQADRCEPDDRLLALSGLVGRTFSLSDILRTLIHPEDRLRFADSFAKAIEPGGTGTLREEVRVAHADGSERWLSIIGRTAFEPVANSKAPGQDGIQRAVQMSGMAADITERKQREAKLALLDRIAADCAHLSAPEEIVQVVGARVGAYLQTASFGLVDVDEARDGIRMLHMWNQEGTSSRPDIARLCDFVNAEFRGSAPAGEMLVVHDSHTDPRIDPSAHGVLGVRSFMSMPFVRDGKCRFMVMVCDGQPRHWSDDKVEAFQAVSERLFPRFEQALAEQVVADDLRDTQLLHELSVRSVGDCDIQTFFDAIVTAAVSIAGAHAGCLQLLDTETNELVLLSAHGFDPALEPQFRRVTAASPTSCGKALAIGRPAVVDLEDRDPSDMRGSLRALYDAGVRSAQSTPLVTRAGRTIGMLSTHWSKPRRRLSERGRRFLDMLARQAAEMLERRSAESALRESERRLSEELADTRLLQRLSAQLIEGHGSESLYATIVDAARSIMRSDYATMQMLSHERDTRGELRLIASHGFSNEAREAWKWVRADAGTTCALALRTGARFVATDIGHCEPMAGTEDQEKLLEAGIHAAQTTPLVSRGGKTLGMITTHWIEPHRPSERDFRLLDILARQAADLMERAQAEDALRRSESQLKDADRRKDEFLATLAHELRNPLAPLRTSLELIRLAGDSRESVDEARVMMEEQVALLVRLVDDLLDVSRITSGKIRLQRRPTPLANLVATAVQANRGALEAAKLTLHVDIPDTSAVIDADGTRFVQVVSNVLNNAIKFTDPGGRISIAAKVMPVAGGDAKELALVISDSGVGISPDMLPRVFDLFTQDEATGHRSPAGLGIGLALARRLIDLHNGSIEAHSAGAGRGSTFTLRMPLSNGTGGARVAPPRSVVPRISRRVVVIDDNPSAARAIQRLVTALGGECEIAHDGETGVAHIRKLRPDLVILDIGMPRLDGYETCRRIRQEFGPDIMIVALTGWGQERDRERAMRAGFNIHLTKPAEPLMLEALLAGHRDTFESDAASD